MSKPQVNKTTAAAPTNATATAPALENAPPAATTTDVVSNPTDPNPATTNTTPPATATATTTATVKETPTVTEASTAKPTTETTTSATPSAAATAKGIAAAAKKVATKKAVLTKAAAKKAALTKAAAAALAKTDADEAIAAGKRAPNPYASASLYVGDLAPEVTEASLYELFGSIGPVGSVRVCREATTRASLGYGYVNFHSVQDAERALDTLNFSKIRGKQCRIMWSQRDPRLRKSGKGNIFVNHLHKSIDNKTLHDTFSVFGGILSCKVAMDFEKGKSRGYAYIHYIDENAAALAIEGVNGMNIANKSVYATWFKPREVREVAFTNVYVKNIPKSMSKEELIDLFENMVTIDGKKGKIDHSYFVDNPDLGVSACLNWDAKNNGQAFARKSVEVLHNYEIKVPIVEKNEEKKKSEDEEKASEDKEDAGTKDDAGKPVDEESGKDNTEEKEEKAPEKKEEGPKYEVVRLYVQRCQKRKERVAFLERTRKKAKKLNRFKHQMGANLYVKNLPPNWTTENLKEEFGRFGAITSAMVKVDTPAGGGEPKSRGFGFVAFEKKENATRAMHELTNTVHDGKPLYVSRAQKKDFRKRYIQKQLRNKKRLHANFWRIPAGGYPFTGPIRRAPYSARGPIIPLPPVTTGPGAQQKFNQPSQYAAPPQPSAGTGAAAQVGTSASTNVNAATSQYAAPSSNVGASQFGGPKSLSTKSTQFNPQSNVQSQFGQNNLNATNFQNSNRFGTGNFKGSSQFGQTGVNTNLSQFAPTNMSQSSQFQTDLNALSQFAPGSLNLGTSQFGAGTNLNASGGLAMGSGVGAGGAAGLNAKQMGMATGNLNLGSLGMQNNFGLGLSNLGNMASLPTQISTNNSLGIPNLNTLVPQLPFQQILSNAQANLPPLEQLQKQLEKQRMLTENLKNLQSEIKDQEIKRQEAKADVAGQKVEAGKPEEAEAKPKAQAKTQPKKAAEEAKEAQDEEDDDDEEEKGDGGDGDLEEKEKADAKEEEKDESGETKKKKRKGKKKKDSSKNSGKDSSKNGGKKKNRKLINIFKKAFIGLTPYSSVPGRSYPHRSSSLSCISAGKKRSAALLEKVPLTLGQLQRAKKGERKRMLGERLYPKIQCVEPRLAGKITGMLLEMEDQDLLQMLGDTMTLMIRVNEALAVLKDHAWKQSQTNPSGKKLRKKSGRSVKNRSYRNRIARSSKKNHSSYSLGHKQKFVFKKTPVSIAQDIARQEIAQEQAEAMARLQATREQVAQVQQAAQAAQISQVAQVSNEQAVQQQMQVGQVSNVQDAQAPEQKPNVDPQAS